MDVTSSSSMSRNSLHVWLSRTPLLDQALEAINDGDRETFIAKMVASHEAKECKLELDYPGCRANEIYAKAGGDRDPEIQAFLVDLFASEPDNVSKERVQALLADERFRTQRSLYAIPAVSSRGQQGSSPSYAGHPVGTKTLVHPAVSNAPNYRASPAASTDAPTQRSVSNHDGGAPLTADKFSFLLMNQAIEAIRNGDTETFMEKMTRLWSLRDRRAFTFTLNAPGCMANIIYAKAGGDNNPVVHDFLVSLYAGIDGNGYREDVERRLADSKYREKRKIYSQ